MITLSIALSEQCNLNCTYCNVDKLSKKKIAPVLFLKEFQRVRQENPKEVIQIDFYGGEPLMQWDSVVEIIEATHQDQDLKYYMPTNGLLLTEEKIEYLNRFGVLVSLSFDGLWQDDNRKQHNNKKTLDLYLSKKSLFKSILKKECHSMIYRGNLNLLENHLFIKKELDLNPNLTLIRDIGVWSYEEALKFNQSFTEMLNWYEENIEVVEMPNLIKEYLRHIILYSSKKIVVDYCGASETHFSFTENKLIACNRFKDQAMINEIPRFRKMTACETCEVKNYCKKGCLYENIKNQGPIDEICTMYKHIYSELLLLIKNKKDNTAFRDILRSLIYES